METENTDARQPDNLQVEETAGEGDQGLTPAEEIALSNFYALCFTHGTRQLIAQHFNSAMTMALDIVEFKARMQVLAEKGLVVAVNDVETGKVRYGLTENGFDVFVALMRERVQIFDLTLQGMK